MNSFVDSICGILLTTKLISTSSLGEKEANIKVMRGTYNGHKWTQFLEYNAKLNFIKALINSSVNTCDYSRCKVKGLVQFQIKFS